MRAKLFLTGNNSAGITVKRKQIGYIPIPDDMAKRYKKSYDMEEIAEYLQECISVFDAKMISDKKKFGDGLTVFIAYEV